MSDTKKLTSHDVCRLIAEHHGIKDGTNTQNHEWSLFFELRNGTGHGAARYVDAFALNLWPSKKHWRVAYEVKVSRSDFLSELKKPEKRSFAWDISNEFYFATLPGVAKPEELPEGCGLLVVNGNKLKKVKPAVQRQARDLSMTEVAAIARLSCRYDMLTNSLWRYQGTELDEKALNELVAAQIDTKFTTELRDGIDKGVKEATENLCNTLGQYCKAFEDAGVPPPDWMVHGSRDLERIYSGAWQARRWVEENVRPGPNMQEVAGAIAAIREAEAAAEKAQREQEQAKKKLDAALARLKTL
jgi:hypothetical protein